MSPESRQKGNKIDAYDLTIALQIHSDDSTPEFYGELKSALNYPFGDSDELSTQQFKDKVNLALTRAGVRDGSARERLKQEAYEATKEVSEDFYEELIGQKSKQLEEGNVGILELRDHVIGHKSK